MTYRLARTRGSLEQEHRTVESRHRLYNLCTIWRCWLRCALFGGTFTHNCGGTMFRYTLHLALICRYQTFTSSHMRMDGTATRSNQGDMHMNVIVDSKGSLHTIEQDQHAHEDARSRSDQFAGQSPDQDYIAQCNKEPGNKCTECLASQLAFCEDRGSAKAEADCINDYSESRKYSWKAWTLEGQPCLTAWTLVERCGIEAFPDFSSK